MLRCGRVPALNGILDLLAGPVNFPCLPKAKFGMKTTRSGRLGFAAPSRSPLGLGGFWGMLRLGTVLAAG